MAALAWDIKVPELEMLTSLEFESSAQDVHQELHQVFRGCENVREENESDDNRKLFVEAEGLVEGAVVDEDGK